MKKVYLISKIENNQVRYLFKIHRKVSWSEKLELATQFETEVKAENFLYENAAGPGRHFYHIVLFHMKSN